MVKSILSSPQEMVLERALSASALRHKVITNNIANVNTPGFKKSDVAFEEQLAEALEPGRAEMSRTHPGHMTGGRGGSFTPKVVTDTTTSLRTDGNNVDIDAEMAGMAKNTLYYNAVAQQLGKYFTNLKSVISEGRK